MPFRFSMATASETVWKRGKENWLSFFPVNSFHLLVEVVQVPMMIVSKCIRVYNCCFLYNSKLTWTRSVCISMYLFPLSGALHFHPLSLSSHSEYTLVHLYSFRKWVDKENRLFKWVEPKPPSWYLEIYLTLPQALKLAERIINSSRDWEFPIC